MAAIPLLPPTMPDIKIIALDLDGTLLNSRKELTEGCLTALERAAAKGIEIVPTTGRFFGGMPQIIRELPFLHYAITINGAQVYDIRSDRAVSKTEIPWQRAIEIMEYLDTLPVLYDCFMDNWGWMSRDLWERVEEYTDNPHYIRMLRELRKPVPELKAYLAELRHDIQKTQFFTRDAALRQRLLKELPAMLPDIAVTTSVSDNVELNHINAHKGAAIRQLAEYLGVSVSSVMACGDGLNDVSMLREAGLGVAMANACDEVKAVADVITESCDEDGVARAIERFCL